MPILLEDLNLGKAEAILVGQAMNRAGGKKVEAAELLGITVHSLRRRMEKHGVRCINEVWCSEDGRERAERELERPLVRDDLPCEVDDG